MSQHLKCNETAHDLKDVKGLFQAGQRGRKSNGNFLSQITLQLPPALGC